jgi:four helix bundle protein
MKSFRTLDLSVEFYEMSERSDIKGNLRDQLLRAASSIALNLSEGNAKYTVKDKRRFFQMAYGSLRECQTIFKLTKIEDKELHEIADRLGAHLYRLLKSEIKEFR